MSAATVQLEAGGLLPAKAKVDAVTTEQIVARSYRHPALGDRPVIRLVSDRLGQAEDLAMEFLGFEAPSVSAPVAVQQRRSLGFAAWALINDPKNARYALDLVKRSKAAARQARSKPGHAWDKYMEMAKDLGRSVRHFLPPFWEEVGRTFMQLGNQTYAGRALNKSLEAERVHALESDRARRRDVVLEFVLSGCLAGTALSDYGNDLQSQYPPAEAFSIFRDLCVRRTRGGMAPWATMPKDLMKLAKTAGLQGDCELEKWLEELIEAPAMGRPSLQFWKSCSSHCKRIVSRNGAFAVALLRHTRPEQRIYGESKLGPWFELLEQWGVLEYLWEDEHQEAPPLGEPVAIWFGRVIRDEVPAPARTLEMLERLTPRLKKEGTPLPLAIAQRYGVASIDIDVLEACLARGIKIDDPPREFSIAFSGWLSANVDHPLRNQDIVESQKDERFKAAVFEALDEALTCRGGTLERGYRQASLEQRAFPLAAGDRPGITKLWREHTAENVRRFRAAGLASFEMARSRLESTLWPDALRLFPDLAEQLNDIEPATVLQRTLQAGVFDEYGLPALEEVADRQDFKIHTDYRDTNVFLTFPSIVLTDKVHAFVISSDGTVKKVELRLPKKGELTSVVVVGNDLAVSYRDANYAGRFHWSSDPATSHPAPTYYYGDTDRIAALLPDGGVFFGQQLVRPGDKQMPAFDRFLNDRNRFWRLKREWDSTSGDHTWKIGEVEPQTGKQVRQSVPSWFEETEGGTIEWSSVELMPAPLGADETPLGIHDGMLGWKAVKRRSGGYFGEGIDGRRFEAPETTDGIPVGMLRQPGTAGYLPVTNPSGGRTGHYWLWDPAGSTVIANLQDFTTEYAEGQVCVLPLHFWHLLKLRDKASSNKLRTIGLEQCVALFKTAAEDRAEHKAAPRTGSKEVPENPLPRLLPAVKKLLPSAPERLAVGIARIVERAERESAAFAAFRNKANLDSRTEATGSPLVVNRKSDLAAAQWGLPSFHMYGDDGKVSISAHLFAAAEFFKGKTPADELPRTNYVWFSMLDDLELRCWKTFWRATATRMAQKEKCEGPCWEFLKLWHELGIGELPGRFDVMEGHPEGAKKKSAWGGYDVEVTAGRAFSILNGEDMFVAIESESYHVDQQPYQFLRYSTAKTPGSPPGYRVKNVRKLQSKFKPAEIAAFISAVESCTTLPLPAKAELAETAQNLSASPAEIGLIWIGGLNVDSYENNFLPPELRAALGFKAMDAAAARQAIRNLNANVVEQLYSAVVAAGPAAPFSPDRGPVLRSIEAAWRAKMPKRLQLDAALQKRLSALGKASRWHRMDHEELLAVAADPVKHRSLQPREVEINIDKNPTYTHLTLAAKNKNEQAVREEMLRSILQLVALVHAETPAGHPARPNMPALIQQTTKLLDHASTLLELRNVHLYDLGRKKPPTPSEWLSKHIGKTKANAKEATSRFDDGLLVAAAMDSRHQALLAFRPAKLKGEGDLARLLGILAIDVADDSTSDNSVVTIVAAIKSTGFQKLTKAILAKNVPTGQWPQNPHHTAPSIIEGIRKKLKLGEDAAVLYAQLLALPDPTTANICTWNGWTAARFKKAAAELVDHKLVLEATRARAGRSIFLPGEWSPLNAPWLPIEAWKLAHLVEYDIDPHDSCPAGGPLVLRPFEDLFAAAWQRVLDGDEPRYEEVAPRKKTK